MPNRSSTRGAGQALASVKLSRPLVDLARLEAATFSRSIGGQIEHWARLGRALEEQASFNAARARTALTGSREERNRYDALDAAMRAADPDEAAAMAELGRSPGAAGYDEDGKLVVVGADRQR
ncbi:TA system antitoxin ParD family protein [Methylobacterium sp. SD21]|uniref:TA system antitoxin ParD family protein n=1 Tax=Methylobacterium litchii TaxID=3138810 RepID=UPI00313DAF75